MKRIFTKELIIGLGLMFIGAISNAQNGLERIVVEKYYVADANDTLGSSSAAAGTLKFGSVTWRIYVDMKQGYRFVSAYGNATHPLSITSSTTFFNNEDRGAVYPTFTFNQAKNNTVMLDSWLSAGAGCAGYFGILKSNDNTTGTAVNADGLLKNNDQCAGSITTKDGLIAGSPGGVSSIGIDANTLNVFNATSQVSGSFIVNNGAWWCNSGVAVGPDTNNMVLIAQVTTDGILEFHLNVQVSPIGSSNVDYYVYSNPTTVPNTSQTEILMPSLNGVFKPDTCLDGSSTFVENKKIEGSSFEVFPNPAQDAINIDITQSKQSTTNDSYTIYNVLGNVVLHKELGQIGNKYSERINISNLSNGFYFLEVNINGVKSTRKIIKN